MGWLVETWEQPSGAAASQDAQLVWPDPAAARLQVAVLDGVTPTRRCLDVVGVAGPMYAAAVTRVGTPRAGERVDRRSAGGDRHLRDRCGHPLPDQAETCVTAADVYPDGRVEVVRAGDCEAWARTAAGWQHLGTGTALTPATEATWQRWQDRNSRVDRDRRQDAEERFLGRAEAWTSTALGRFAHPVIRAFSVSGVTELVLASDGARLSERMLDDLAGWLAGLREWERQRTHLSRAAEKVHDDLTVVRLTRAREPATLTLAA